MLGREADVETIRRSWSAVSEQSLSIDHTELDRSDAAGIGSFIGSAKRSDVIIYPMALVGEATSNEAVIAFSDNDLDAIQETSGTLLTAVRNASQYAGETSAIPLGARLPALLATVPTETMSSWKEYDAWVQGELGGKAAEPLSAGWAGTMFLWRASSTIDTTWLFSRETLDPVVTGDGYVRVLTQMKETAARYELVRPSPEKIWEALDKGRLKAAIGFPQTQSIDGVSVGNLPNELKQPRVLLDLFSPVVSISSGCRQSRAAKQFAGWLCGGDGSENLRRQIPSLTVTRQQRLVQAGGGGDEQSGYGDWLREQLGNSSTLATIQLYRAAEYYVVLDEEIGNCLDGKKKPQEALDAVSNRWQQITAEVGVDVQTRAWRRAQGMRS